MLRSLRTDSGNQDFIALVKLLDDDLAIRDGDDHAFYHKFNGIEALKHAIVLYNNEKAVGCGAMKELEPGVMEIKRMYILPSHRGKGLATKILEDLESWAQELKMERCVLETGKRQPEAISLYLKNQYQIISNYEPYVGVENSVCFEKLLKLG